MFILSACCSSMVKFSWRFLLILYIFVVFFLIFNSFYFHTIDSIIGNFKNHGLSIDLVWPNQIWLATGKYFLVDLLVIVILHRILDVQLLCHCTQIPMEVNEKKQLVTLIKYSDLFAF